MALDVLKGTKLWTFPLTRGSLAAGVLATRGDVVFAASAEGNLIALDARTGKSLWHFQTGGQIMSSPMSYSVDGMQFVAITAGNTVYSFALPDRRQGD
jgi:alcohol dehydrogenase (cytochrome c)